MTYKIGDLLFFNSNHIYSKIIRLYNKIKYGEPGLTHVGIIADKKEGYSLVYEALSEGFVCNWYEDWWLNLKIEEGIIFKERTKIKLSNLNDNCENYLGRGYGWMDILAIGLSLIGIDFKTTGASKLICSEAVARVLYDSSNKKINFEKEYNKAYDLITPMDIYRSEFLK
jgi:hypothetical protein